MKTETPELVTCNCNHCNSHIQFERSQLQISGASTSGAMGPSVTCPHCGMDTILYVPNEGVSRTAALPPLVPVQRRGRALAIAIATALIGIALLAFFLNKLIQSGVLYYLPAGIGIAVYLAVIVFLFLLALLWILFPVFVYFSLNKMISLLSAIERNTRNR